MKFSGIDFRIRASNNHASPSGALPFLLPASADTTSSKSVQTVPSAKLQRWCMNNSSSPIEESGDLRYEAYLSLLDHRIRRAWVRSAIKFTRVGLIFLGTAILCLSLLKLSVYRRIALHPPRIRQPIRAPHNSPRIAPCS